VIGMPSPDATGRSGASAHHQNAKLPAVSSPRIDTAKVSNIQAMNQQIAVAAEQQGAVAEEISRSVVNVRDISEQTATASDETAASSIELARLGSELQAMVSRFRV
jgi:hypothetical protein